MTLRKLVKMAEARQTSDWNRTAMICVLMANINRDSSKRAQPFSLHDFNPYLKAPVIRKRQKTAKELFARLANWPGATSGTVTATTWTPTKKTTPDKPG